MKNKLSGLNNHLFEQIERLNDEKLKGQSLDAEVSRSKEMCRVANSIIANSALLLKAERYKDDIEGFKVPDIIK